MDGDPQFVNPLTQQVISDGEIMSLSELVAEHIDLDIRIQEAEDALKKLTDRRKYLAEVSIPNKLDDLGMMTIKLSDGKKVEIKPFYSVSMPDKEKAFKWLDDNGHGGLIKTVVERPFARTQREEALEFVRANPEFSLSQSIHFQTMQAFAKEIYTNNGTLPETFFSVYQGKKTKIALPR